ncbi:MAG: arsenic resistance N-acetyltransferase ArsN2 [Sphingobacteriales bacterium]
MRTVISNTLTLAIALQEEERLQAIGLLKQSDLPTEDLDDDKLLYLLKDEERIIGTAGLEIFEDCALLRSVSIVKEEQGKGFGKFLNESIENYARESGINCLYLLTTTAKDFFDKQGYCEIKRDDVPEAIKETAAFISLCPSSAIVMKKRI